MLEIWVLNLHLVKIMFHNGLFQIMSVHPYVYGGRDLHFLSLNLQNHH